MLNKWGTQVRITIFFALAIFFQGQHSNHIKVNFGQFCSIAMSPFPMFSGFMRKSMWNYRPPLCPMFWRGLVATSRAITKTTNSSTQTWTSWPITTIRQTKLSSAFGPCPSTPRSLYWVVFVFVFALSWPFPFSFFFSLPVYFWSHYLGYREVLFMSFSLSLSSSLILSSPFPLSLS